MTVADLLFQLPAVQGWETRLQATFIAPAEPPDADLLLEQIPPPRANIVVSRTPTEASEPLGECNKFISLTAQSVPGLEVVDEPAAAVFGDRVSGVITTVRFPATEQVTLRQLHAFRIDGGVLTQLVATVDDAGGAQSLADMQGKLLSFSPNAQTRGLVVAHEDAALPGPAIGAESRRG